MLYVFIAVGGLFLNAILGKVLPGNKPTTQATAITTTTQEK